MHELYVPLSTALQLRRRINPVLGKNACHTGKNKKKKNNNKLIKTKCEELQEFQFARVLLCCTFIL